MSIRRCKSCEFRGVALFASDTSVSWETCRHSDFIDLYEGGRALEESPEWCPFYRAPKSKALNSIIPEKDLKVVWSPDLRGFRVTIVHLKTKISVTLAGDHSLYFTKNKAIKQLAIKLKEAGARK